MTCNACLVTRAVALAQAITPHYGPARTLAFVKALRPVNTFDVTESGPHHLGGDHSAIFFASTLGKSDGESFRNYVLMHDIGSQGDQVACTAG